MRPAGPIPSTYAAAYEHSQLKGMIDASEPNQAHELGHLWNEFGNEIMDFGESLQRTATSSEAIWVGQAGNTARAALSALATWSQHTGQGAQFMSTTVRTQAEAAHTAKLAMPDPVPYDPAKYQAQLNATSNPADWARIIGDAREQADQRDAAHAEAVRVVETYGASLRDTNAAMPVCTPPPKFGDGATGVTPGDSMPGGGTAGVVHQGDGAGGRTAGDAPGTASGGSPTTPGIAVGRHGSREAPPSSTPGQSVSYAPGIPGGGVPAGGSGGGPSGPSFLPATAAVIDGARWITARWVRGCRVAPGYARAAPATGRAGLGRLGPAGVR